MLWIPNHFLQYFSTRFTERGIGTSRTNDTFHAFEEMYNQMMMYVPR